MKSLCNLCFLTHKAVVLLQFEGLADVFDAARREFLVVFTHLICGMREHQVPAFTSIGTKIPTVRALIVLKQNCNTQVKIESGGQHGDRSFCFICYI